MAPAIGFTSPQPNAHVRLGSSVTGSAQAGPGHTLTSVTYSIGTNSGDVAQPWNNFSIELTGTLCPNPGTYTVTVTAQDDERSMNTTSRSLTFTVDAK